MKKLFLLFCFLLISSQCFAAYLYVDPFQGDHADETWNGTNGQSYTSNHADFPGAGTGYNTLQAAVTAMSGGDDLYLRGGEYDNAELTGGSHNTTTIADAVDGSSENYTSIQSFPGEWAILDGENDCDDYGGGRPRGLLSSGTSGARTTHYLKLERLEIKRGANSAGTWAAGLCVGGRGNIYRYLYIHDNYATDSNNPSGIRGNGWRDSTVEYCLFVDNGTSQAAGGSYNGNNSAHITPFSAYDSLSVSHYGPGSNYDGVYNNIIRYNYFLRGGSAYKVKGNQLLTGRASGDFETTYADEGDWFHHNIIVDSVSVGVKIKGDFTTVSNTIFDDANGAVIVGYENDITGTTLNNNTIISCRNSTWSFPPVWHHAQQDPDWSAWGSGEDYYAFDYNNIIVDNIDIVSGKGALHFGAYTARDIFALDHLTLENIYFYNDDDGDVISIYDNDGGNELYTGPEWESAYSSDVPVYINSGGTPSLFQDTSGADQYKINSAHIVEGSIEAGTGGSGGTHEYRGHDIPSYLGAANPDDDDWVDGVLDLDASYMTSAEAGSDPTWIEGSEAVTAEMGWTGSGNVGWTGSGTITWQ